MSDQSRSFAAQNALAAKSNLYGVAENQSTMSTGTKNFVPAVCSQRRSHRIYVGGIEWWALQKILAAIAAELVGTFAIGLVLALSDYYVFGGFGNPGLIANAAVRSAVTAGLMLAFIQFYAGQFNPMYTVLGWCHEKKMWQLDIIGCYLGRCLGQFLGFLFSAWLISAILPAPISCTQVNSLFGNGFAYLFETLGSVFLIHVWVLAVYRKTSGMTGVLGLAAAEFALVAAFAPITGGSLNLFRSLGVGLVRGSACNSSIGIYVGSMFTAVVVSIVLLMYIFPAKALPQEPATKVELMMHTEPKSQNN